MPWVPGEGADLPESTPQRVVGTLRVVLLRAENLPASDLARPEQTRIPLFAARTLNATGQSRVTLSLR